MIASGTLDADIVGVSLRSFRHRVCCENGLRWHVFRAIEDGGSAKNRSTIEKIRNGEMNQSVCSNDKFRNKFVGKTVEVVTVEGCLVAFPQIFFLSKSQH